MTRRLYIAPIVTLSIGSRSPLGSKVLEYGIQQGISSVLSRDKTWALTTADFDNTQHALVAADPDITDVPFSALDNTWNDFTVQQRTAIGNRLETFHVPMDWISGSTSVADLIRMAARVALIGQMLKADALDNISLDSTFGSLSAARRNRILAWAADNNVDTTGLSGSTTIRAMLRALVVRFPWNATHELAFMRGGGGQAFSISAQLLKAKLKRGEISLEDLPFTAQATASEDFATDLSAWSQDTGTWGVSGGVLTFTNAADNYYKLRHTATAPGTNDYYAEFDGTAADNTGLGWGAGARLANGTGNNNTDGYTYVLYGGDFGYLSELTNSGEAILDTGAAVSAIATLTNIRITANGTAITGNRNGAADDVSATDATYASGGWGIIVGDFGTVSGNISQWDAADLAADTTAIQDMITSDGMIAWRR